MNDAIVASEGMTALIHRAWSRLRWFGREVWHQFWSGGCLKSAAALTYTTLFAIVPMMTVGYRVMSLLPDLSGIGTQIQEFVFENFVPRSSELVRQRLQEFSDQARDLTAIGLVFLGLTAFMMLVTIERAFNQIWQVPQERHGMQRFLTYWAVLTFGPPLIGIGLLLSTYLFSIPMLADIDTIGVRQTVLVYLPGILSTVAFTLMFALVPNCHVPFLHALLGGILTTLGLEGAKAAFALTIANSNMTLIYGTFAAVPAFLSWLYLVWALVLFGAIFVRTLALEPEKPATEDEPALVGALRVLDQLNRAHALGRGMTETALALAVPLTTDDRKRVFAALNDLKLVHRTDADELALGRSLDAVSLWELYERLPEGVVLRSPAKIPGLPGLEARLDEFARDAQRRLGINLATVLANPSMESEK
jgi:membrane protein